jgi:hypothetical protein
MRAVIQNNSTITSPLRDMLELYREIDISDWATVDQEHKRYQAVK